jgi:hypothetical protein
LVVHSCVDACLPVPRGSRQKKNDRAKNEHRHFETTHANATTTTATPTASDRALSTHLLALQTTYPPNTLQTPSFCQCHSPPTLASVGHGVKKTLGQTISRVFSSHALVCFLLLLIRKEQKKEQEKELGARASVTRLKQAFGTS